MRAILDRLAVVATLGVLLFSIAYRAAGSPPVAVKAHGSNPDHISVTVGPGRSDTVASTPFDSTPYINNGQESSTPGTFSTAYGEDDCGGTHGIDYCHHHAAASAEWSIDIDADPTGDDDVYLSVQGYPNYVTVTNYIYDITNMCSGTDPAGKEVWVEVWARLESDQIWRSLGIVTYAHISPTVSAGEWYWPGTKVGDATDYTHYTDCFSGPHVHMDAYDYSHLSQWYTASWFDNAVTYSSSYWSLTPIGYLGGSNDDDGPDNHGGSFIGW